MKMPSRGDYADAREFLTAIDHWTGASRAAYQHLKEMYEATPETTGYPDWVDAATFVKNVSMDRRPTPDEIEPVLNTLASATLNDGCRIVRVAHGIVEQDGLARWACFAEGTPI